MRRSDFLPVGAAKDTEQLERGYESENSDGSDYSGGLEHVGGFENALRERDSERSPGFDSEDSEASDYAAGLEHSGGFERALREINADCLSSRDDGCDEGTLHADFLPL